MKSKNCTLNRRCIHHHSLHQHRLRAEIEDYGLAESAKDLGSKHHLHSVQAVIQAILQQSRSSPLLTAALTHLLGYLGGGVTCRHGCDGEVRTVGIVEQGDAVQHTGRLDVRSDTRERGTTERLAHTEQGSTSMLNGKTLSHDIQEGKTWCIFLKCF